HLMHIANAAHGAGFLFGLSVGWLFFAPRRRPLWAIPLVALLLMTVISLTWMPWSGNWLFWKGNQAFKQQRYPEAISLYQRSLRLGGDAEYNWANIAG